MLSGGSVASWSVTFAVWLPLDPHEIENQLPVTFTASVNVIVTLLDSATLAAPSAGLVLETAGAWSPVLRGLGAPTVKSALLLSVSTLPLPFRSAAVVLLSVAVGSVSEQFVPLP